MTNTPGPWAAERSNAMTCRHPRIRSDSGDVGQATWQSSEAQTDATARLMAAAPDMLAALQALVGRETAIPDKHMQQARAAIVKATGGAA